MCGSRAIRVAPNALDTAPSAIAVAPESDEASESLTLPRKAGPAKAKPTAATAIGPGARSSQGSGRAPASRPDPPFGLRPLPAQLGDVAKHGRPVGRPETAPENEPVEPRPYRAARAMPLDFRLHQPLDDRRKVSSSHVFSTVGASRAPPPPQLRAPRGEIGGESVERRGDRLAGLGERSASSAPAGAGAEARFGLGPSPEGLGRVASAAGSGAMGVPAAGRGRDASPFVDDLRRGRGRRCSAPSVSEPSAGWRSSAMIVRIEARISSIDGSCALLARRSASCSRSLTFRLTRPSSSLRPLTRPRDHARASP